MKHNPYAAPTALLGGPTGLDRDAATVERRAHLGVERSLQSAGNVLVFVGGVSLLYMVLGLSLAGIRVVDTLGASEGRDPQNLALVVLFLIGCGLLGAVHLCCLLYTSDAADE